MTPNEVIIIILPELQNISKFISKNDELQHDLTSEVVLALLNNKRLVQIYQQEDIYNYSFRIAYIKWNINNGDKIGSTSCFKSMYRDSTDNLDIEDFKHKLQTETPSNTIELINQSIELLPNEILKQTYKKYVQLGCNLKELADEVGVSRFHLKKIITDLNQEIKQIYERHY